MDTNNRKFKILYKCIKAHTNNNSLLTAIKNLKSQERHKRDYLSENGGYGEKNSGEWAQSRKGSDRKSNRTRQKKNKREDIKKKKEEKKKDQSDSPEIPDKGGGGDIRNLRPPFGVGEEGGGGGGGGAERQERQLGGSDTRDRRPARDV